MSQDWLSFPSKIQIQTVNLCNYGCPMCPYPQTSAGVSRAEMEPGLLRKLVGEVREAGRKVKLCLMLQNEPLLDRRFTDFLDYAHAAEDAVSSVHTITNGSALSAELLDRLTGYERFHLTVSVNATDAERYQKIHERDFWKRINGLLTRWQGERSRVRVSFVLDSGSLEEGRAFQRYWRDEQGYQVRFVPINSRINSVTLPPDSLLAEDDFGHCHYPVDTLNVLVDGSVILCCNDWKHELRFGNLHASSIREVWNSPGLVKFREAAVRGDLRKFAICKGCDYPIRSSRRIALEALVGEPAAPPPGAAGLRIVEHGALIRPDERGPATPLLVVDIDPGSGSIHALSEKTEERLPLAVEYGFQIGHSGAFSFGSLETVWCSARLSVVSEGVRPGDLTALRIDLDHDSPGFQFLPWYFADWSLT